MSKKTDRKRCTNRTSQQPSTALAFDLIGRGVGICLEYLSMWSGVKALGFVGALLYALVLLLPFIANRGARREGQPV